MAASGSPMDTASPDTVSVLLVGLSELRRQLSATATEEEELLVTEATRGRDAYRWITTQPGRVDCVVCAQDLPDTTGVSLLESVRDAGADVPFLLVATDGSESVASRAITADVSEYVAAESLASLDVSELYERIQRSVADAESERAIRHRARQFESLLDDAERYVWVLDSDGIVRETSGTVDDAIDAADRTEAIPFWERPLWDHTDGARGRLRDGTFAAADGEMTRFEVRLSTTSDGPTALDLTFLPVVDPTGSITSVVVEGVDISERARLEEELRESEELHRVTLNNMTDTVLVTDDDGHFTYVCPNVHFIFGYSVDEIREMESIDALLGADLFDRTELRSEGTLTNIETTAEDKAGREHTLLVNVREVSIQGGTTLYSCRDITKRKERERALTALHGTSRELLYAETAREIAQRITDDATDVLDVPGSAVYLFESENNALQPVAVSEGFDRLYGPPSAVEPREDTLLGQAFVDQTATTYRSGDDPTGLEGPSTELRSAIIIPLGEHGVFLVAADRDDAFDAITEEIADLLAATGEAALDRVERETELRERDRELQRRNRQLTRLNRTNEIIRDIDKLLVEADSREEIERAVCGRLTDDDRFELAWIGTVDEESGTVQPQAWAGSDHGYLDAIERTIGGDATDPAIRTADTREPTVVANIGEDLRTGSWRKAALSRGYQSVASVPLSYDGFLSGVLAVYATQPDVFDEMTRTVLYELGETIASAIRSAERKTALMSDLVTELTFQITDSQCVLYTLAETAGCSLSLKGGVHPTSEGVRILVEVEDGPADAVIASAREMIAIDEVRAIATTESDAVVQLTISTPFIGTELSDRGAAVRSFAATPTRATMTVDVPETVDVREIDDLVSARYPESYLLAQKDRDRSLMTEPQFRAEVLEAVTDRQLEVVQTAYFSGYFDSPRRNSGEEIAETLGISSAAFYTHVRTVQAKLFSTLFERMDSLPIDRG